MLKYRIQNFSVRTQVLSSMIPNREFSNELKPKEIW
jgi:hypothetical protein